MSGIHAARHVAAMADHFARPQLAVVSQFPGKSMRENLASFDAKHAVPASGNAAHPEPAAAVGFRAAVPIEAQYRIDAAYTAAMVSWLAEVEGGHFLTAA